MYRIDFTGNVGKDAIHREGKNGDKYCAFSVAIKTGKDTTQWADCLKKDPEGKFLLMVKKGARIYISGKPKIGHYINDTGEIVDTLTVFVDFLEPQEKKPEQTEAAVSEEGRAFPEKHDQPITNPIVGPEDSEDLPF